MNNYKSKEIYSNDLPGRKSMEDKFPWLKKFFKIMCTANGNKSCQLLEQFLLIYIQFMTKTVKECSNNVTETIQLRNNMRNTLTFFYFYWKDVKQNYSDHSSYLNKMSQLLGIYLNMELKISKNKSSTSKISAKLLSMLWIYLDESKEHVFRTLLRINPILKKYAKICDPIFMKCFTNLMTYPETVGDVVYIRCLLMFKIWKSMKKDIEQKKKINEMAMAKLGPCTPKLQPNLIKCIPQPSVDCKNETMWLLQFNVFNIQEACKQFLLFEEGKSKVVSPRELSIAKSLTDYSDMQTSLAWDKTCATEQLSCSSALYAAENKLSNNRYNVKKNRNSISSRRGHKFRNSVLEVNPEKIILIDLTDEDTDKLQKKMENKRKKRKLEWLQLVRKKSKMQKSVSNVVEIVDGNNTGNVHNKSENTLLQFLPIFNDNVWDNTQYLITTDKEQKENDSCSSCFSNIYDIVHKNKDLLDITKVKSGIFDDKICDFCNECIKQDGTPHSQISHLVKILKLAIQTFCAKINDSQFFLSLEENNRDENTGTKKSNHNVHCRNELFTEEKFSTNTTSIVKMCQNSQTQVQRVKHELLIKGDSNEIHSMENIYKDALFNLQSFENHLQNMPLKINNCKTQVNTVQEKLLPKSTECEHGHEKNNSAAFRSCQKHIEYCNTENEVYICDRSITNNTCNAFNECANALIRISQLILSICTEKQQTDLLKPKLDIYSILVTIVGDKVMKSLLTDSIHDINSTLVNKLHKTLEISGDDEFLKFWRHGTVCESSTSDVVTALKKDCEQQTVFLTSHSHPEDFKGKRLESTNSSSAENSLFTKTKLEYETKCKCKEGTYNKTFLNREKEFQENDEYKILVTSPESNFTDKMLTHDDFKDIDILDSILHGDMNMENEHSILEDTESSLISSDSNDNSANVLNCITKFIKQSEDNCINDETDSLNTKSEVSIKPVTIKPLPEGSLGTTGILNSLLDFDLIHMDIASNDFMYTNIQTVNPRIIKKNLEKDFLETNKFDETCTYECETKGSSLITNNTDHFLVKKKDESCVNQKDLVDSSVDIVGFGLNPSELDIFDLPPLEDEELISDSRIVSSSCDSPLLINTDIMPPELKETSSKYTSISPIHDLSSDVMIEQSYTYVKEDITKSFQSLNDTKNQLPNKTCTSKDIPLNQLADSIANDTPFSLSHISVSPGSVQFKELNNSTEHSLSICNSSSFVTVNLKKKTGNLNQFNKSKLMLKSPECVELIERSCTQCNKKHSLKQKEMTKKSLLPKTSNKKLNCAKRIKMDDSKSPCLFQTDQEEGSNNYPFVGSGLIHKHNIHNINDVPQSKVQFSYKQKHKKRMYLNKNEYTQWGSINLKQLNVNSQKNKRVLISMHEANTSSQLPTFNMDVEHDRSTCTLQEDLQDSNIMHQLPSKCNSHQVRRKSHLKGRRRCFVHEMSSDDPKLSITNSECTGGTSDNILMKPKMRWFIRNVNTQTPLFLKNQMIKKSTNLLFNNEELAIKKRKIISKFLPLSTSDLTTQSKQASNSIMNSNYQK